MAINAQQVKELREKTGAPLMDCKRALEEAGGDEQKAMLVLREKGLAKAEKKRSRTASEGIICSYIHDRKLGVMIELNCETDFVARNEQFQQLAKEICMQIAAMKPLAVSRDDLPAEIVETEKAIYAKASEGKPQEVAEKLVAGKMEKFYQQACLLDQPYIRDEKKTVNDLLNEIVGRMGEKIEVQRFVILRVGEEA